MSVVGDINIFDYSNRPSSPEALTMNPDFILKGHEKEGYGISWNPNVEGLLASGGYDNRVCV